MPLYHYRCETCGEFADWQPMSRAAEPSACPSCGGHAPRTMSLPALALLDGATRKAHSINERSADEPKVVRKGAPALPGGRGHDHDHRHAHGHGHGLGHAHRSSRPWMIGH